MGKLSETKVVLSGNSLVAENERYYASSNHGKSTEWILCRFCNTKTLAYTWSLAGSGKKCDSCENTLHTLTGSIMRLKSKQEAIEKLDMFS